MDREGIVISVITLQKYLYLCKYTEIKIVNKGFSLLSPFIGTVMEPQRTLQELCAP